MNKINIDATIKEIREYKRLLEETQAQIDALQDIVKAEMNAAGIDTLNGNDYKVTYKDIISNRLDTAGLKKAFPDIAEQFTKTTTSKRFVIQ